MPTILVDEARAWEVLGVLLDALERKLPPYDKVVPVSGPSILPPGMKWKSLDHGSFLFGSCSYMRGKINSATAFTGLGRLFQGHEWIFRPSEFIGLNGKKEKRQAEIGELLTSNGLGFDAKKTSEFWVANYQKLGEHWEGDPVNLYSNVETYEDVCQILIRKGRFHEDKPNGFFGFRHKMASMLTYFFSDAGFMRPILFPVPVDFHILRVLVASDILSVPGIGVGSRLSVDALSAAARALTMKYCGETNTDPLKLADALWHLSRISCRRAPGNRSHVGKYEARKTPIVNRAPTFWTSGEERAFHSSCGNCPISSHCRWSIPSSNYYIQGVVGIRGPRAKPLDLFVS